jgi:quercetin dioxygenase-like cupin family protein
MARQTPHGTAAHVTHVQQDDLSRARVHRPWLHFDGALLQPHRAHDGTGEVQAARVVERAEGPLAFIDQVVLPRGTSVGRHTHGLDEELYVVVSGEGEAVVDGEARTVRPGDVVHNRVGGTHEVRNDGAQELRMVVIDVRVGPNG